MFPQSMPFPMRTVSYTHLTIAGDDPYTKRFGGGNKYSLYDAPIEKNTKTQLLYRDEKGNVSTKFPAGYTIGYFIIPDGYTPYAGIDYSINYIYSNKEWNKIYACLLYTSSPTLPALSPRYGSGRGSRRGDRKAGNRDNPSAAATQAHAGLSLIHISSGPGNSSIRLDISRNACAQREVESAISSTFNPLLR